MLHWNQGTHLEHCIIIGFILFALETKYILIRNFLWLAFFLINGVSYIFQQL